MEDRSIKIKKTRNTKDGERNHICGCGKSYKSNPALYLHIQRIHDGIAPENTVRIESTKTKPAVVKKTGRPQRADKDIDNIPKSQEEFENSQNALMLYLGEDVEAVAPMDAKKDLRAIYETLARELSAVDGTIGTFFDLQMDKILKSGVTDININDISFLQERDQLLSGILLWFGRYITKMSYTVDIGVLLYRMREFILKQDIDFGSKKGFVVLDLKENIAALASKVKKEFRCDWNDSHSKAVRLLNEFLKCAFVREN